MTYHVWVIGGNANEAEEFIRDQNDSRDWPKDTEFVNVTRPEQLMGVKRGTTVVTLGRFDRHPDVVRFERLISERSLRWISY